MEKILTIEEIGNLQLGNVGKSNGSNGSRLGITGMFNALMGYGEYDGYKIVTDQHTYHILIDNGQDCCENWGYFSTNDDIQEFINSDLLSIDLIDMEESKLDDILIDKCIWGLGEGGIQFVNFETSNGLLQFAVYNSHNGYYGHSIIVAKDTEVLKADVL